MDDTILLFMLVIFNRSASSCDVYLTDSSSVLLEVLDIAFSIVSPRSYARKFLS